VIVARIANKPNDLDRLQFGLLLQYDGEQHQASRRRRRGTVHAGGRPIAVTWLAITGDNDAELWRPLTEGSFTHTPLLRGVSAQWRGGAVRSCAATQASKQRVVCPLILD
jgi:hypothetical protein